MSPLTEVKAFQKRERAKRKAGRTTDPSLPSHIIVIVPGDNENEDGTPMNLYDQIVQTFDDAGIVARVQEFATARNKPVMAALDNAGLNLRKPRRP